MSIAVPSSAGAGGDIRRAARPASSGDTWRVSHHEAAHAVIAVVCGVRVHRVHINATEDVNGQTMVGDCEPWPDAMLTAAGPIADNIICGRVVHRVSTDRKRLDAIKARIAQEVGTSTEQATVEQLRQVARRYEDARTTGEWKRGL